MDLGIIYKRVWRGQECWKIERKRIVQIIKKKEREKIEEYKRITLIADGIKIFTTVLVERKVIVTESNYGI